MEGVVNEINPWATRELIRPDNAVPGGGLEGRLDVF